MTPTHRALFKKFEKDLAILFCAVIKFTNENANARIQISEDTLRIYHKPQISCSLLAANKRRPSSREKKNPCDWRQDGFFSVAASACVRRCERTAPVQPSMRVP